MSVSRIVGAIKANGSPIIAVDLSILMFQAMMKDAREVAMFGHAKVVALSVLEKVMPFLRGGVKVWFVIDGCSPPTKAATKLRESIRLGNLNKANELSRSLAEGSMTMDPEEFQKTKQEA